MSLSRTIHVVALALALGACASQPTAPDGGSRFDLAREAFLAENYDRAFTLMAAEAEMNNAEAQYALGYMYYNGLGTQPDVDKALKWIRAAAQAGEPKAVEALGRMASLVAEPPAAK